MGDYRLVRPERRTGSTYIHSRNKTLEHRLIMEETLGRPLAQGEIVHHINGDIRDNRSENLQLTTRQEHIRIHYANGKTELKPFDEPNTKVLCECGCGTEIDKWDRKNRRRHYVLGHNQRGRRWNWGEPHG